MFFVKRYVITTSSIPVLQEQKGLCLSCGPAARTFFLIQGGGVRR